MTFNQWFASKPFYETRFKLALEAVWNGLISGGHSPRRVAILLNDLLDEFPAEEEAWR